MPSFTEENLTFDPVEDAVAAFSELYQALSAYEFPLMAQRKPYELS